jgi:hypothetical protein
VALAAIAAAVTVSVADVEALGSVVLLHAALAVSKTTVVEANRVMILPSFCCERRNTPLDRGGTCEGLGRSPSASAGDSVVEHGI